MRVMRRSPCRTLNIKAERHMLGLFDRILIVVAHDDVWKIKEVAA